RQLQQWVNDAMAEEDWQGKGILVANLYCGFPPGQREPPFPDNCVTAAKRFGICLLTTTQLFRACCEYQEQKLDVTAFWETIFNCGGLCSFRELAAMVDWQTVFLVLFLGRKNYITRPNEDGRGGENTSPEMQK